MVWVTNSGLSSAPTDTQVQHDAQDVENASAL